MMFYPLVVNGNGMLLVKQLLIIQANDQFPDSSILGGSQVVLVLPLMRHVITIVVAIRDLFSATSRGTSQRSSDDVQVFIDPVFLWGYIYDRFL